MEFYFNKPAFRPGVKYLLSGSGGVFTYDQTTFEVECSTDAAGELAQLCERLKTGFQVSEANDLFGEFSPHASDVLHVFDRYGFLTESDPPRMEACISGSAFWREVSALAEKAKAAARGVFYPALLNRHASRGALVRYALEYFHVVRHGPRIIAGATAHVSDRETERLMEGFLRSELGHDKMLLQSLAAVGITEEIACEEGPLPETFALIASFQVWADQEPLTFKALAFLLEEGSATFHEAFVKACADKGLGEAFFAPIVRHAGINDDGDHGAISEKLLSLVEAVSTEERIVVAKHLSYAVEQLAALEYAILANPVVST